MKKFEYYGSYAKIGLFTLIGLAIFFFSAFLVVSISTSSPGKYQIPSLLNKYYIDVHNELSKNIKVKIKKTDIPDQSRGLILKQSLPAGKYVEKEKTTLTLTVNAGIDQVTVPELVNQTLSYAQASLKSIPVENFYYQLDIGTITYMGGDDKNPEKESSNQYIIAQWPPAGTYVNTDQKVSLLVSGYPETEKKKVN